MQKTFLLACILFTLTNMSAQKAITSTDQFTIEGLVTRNIVVTLDSINSYPTTRIDSVVITNHLGERKSTLKNLAVIPIRDFLSQAVIPVESPRLLSEIYFTFIATDGYKVVFSWNEIFNNSNGREVYIIVEKNGKKLENLDDRIALIAPTDQMTGRRYVKGLQKIIVRRAE